jgi:methionyl-tRNA formyltransferase
MRGRNLAYHAIMEGREQFGASVHYMDEEFDTGKVIEVLRFPIEPHHTAGDLVNLAHDHLAVLFKKYVPLALRGMVPSRNQDAGVYYKKEPINNEVVLTDKQKRLVRALTVSPKFYPKVLIGGRNYRIIPEIK